MADDDDVTDPTSTLEDLFESHLEVARATRPRLLSDRADLAEESAAMLQAGGKLLVFGNAGSAADAQHPAAELVGRFRRPRRASWRRR